MKRIAAFCAATVLSLGMIEGCSSDESGGNGKGTGDAGQDGAASSGGANGGGSGGAAGSTGGAVGSGGSSDASVGGSSSDAGGDGRSPEQTGEACKTAADCFPNLDAGVLSGAVECLDKVQDGYCTHRCDTDADCCAVPGECRTDLRQVCSPFENTGYKVCFLACEAADIRLPGDAGMTLPDGAPAFTDANDFCQKEANVDFICRSTGGGAKNRKVCLPGGTAGDGGPPNRDSGTPGPDAAPDAAPEASAPVDAGNG